MKHVFPKLVRPIGQHERPSDVERRAETLPTEDKESSTIVKQRDGHACTDVKTPTRIIGSIPVFSCNVLKALHHCKA